MPLTHTLFLDKMRLGEYYNVPVSYKQRAILHRMALLLPAASAVTLNRVFCLNNIDLVHLTRS